MSVDYTLRYTSSHEQLALRVYSKNSNAFWSVCIRKDGCDFTAIEEDNTHVALFFPEDKEQIRNAIEQKLSELDVSDDKLLAEAVARIRQRVKEE